MNTLRKRNIVVAVSQRREFVESRRAWGDFHDFQLQDWLSELPVIAVPVPNRLGKKLTAWLEKVSPDGFLLSGGEDIGDFPERDHAECEMVSYARARLLPVLGICRGMQMLAHTEGVPIIKIPNHVGDEHPLVSVSPLDWPDTVNSFHTNTIEYCPAGYEVTAQHLDGSIEAIRNNQLGWEGWMWHPERRETFSTKEIMRARALYGLSHD